MKIKYGVWIGLLLLFVCVDLARAQRGTITGKVTLSDPPERPTYLKVDTDRPYCGSFVPSRHLLVDGKAVASVVVYLEGVAAADMSARAVEVRNQNCDFRPSIQVVDVGGELRLRNTDGINHTVQIKQAGQLLAEYSLDPLQSASHRQTLERPGRIDIECKAHRWMRSYVWVFDHPYYTLSDTDGTFELPFVVPGSYRLRIWHSVLGTQTRDITVEADRTLRADFVLEAARPQASN